jgi:hypothetical protein
MHAKDMHDATRAGLLLCQMRLAGAKRVHRLDACSMLRLTLQRQSLCPCHDLDIPRARCVCLCLGAWELDVGQGHPACGHRGCHVAVSPPAAFNELLRCLPALTPRSEHVRVSINECAWPQHINCRAGFRNLI